MNSALNRVLILAQECRGKMLQNRTGIMDSPAVFLLLEYFVKGSLNSPAGGFFWEYFAKGVINPDLNRLIPTKTD